MCVLTLHTFTALYTYVCYKCNDINYQYYCDNHAIYYILYTVIYVANLYISYYILYKMNYDINDAALLYTMYDNIYIIYIYIILIL